MRVGAAVWMLGLAACAGGDLSGPTSAERVGGQPSLAEAEGAAHIVAFGQNIYVGTNVDAVLPALLSGDLDQAKAALEAAAATLAETDFTVRAAAIADEMARTRPHVVGLNEVSMIAVDLTPLGVPVAVQEDFLAELLAALAARGLDYVVAGEIQTLVAAPTLPYGASVNIVDRDVMLVNADRATVGPGVVEQHYDANVGTIAAGVTLMRGFVMVPAVIEGRTYTIAVTHLESDLAGWPPLDPLRALQATELVGSLPATGPVILLGDFNDVPGSLMYQVMAGAGLTDVWATLRPQSAGYTCCNSDNLANAHPEYVKRIDYVFARGLDGPQDSLIGQIDRFGDTRSALLAGPAHGLWPSDHAGLVTRLTRPAAVLP